MTVFGFTPEDSALVLRELQDCGRIVNYGAFAPGRVNWLHVEFGSRHEAQRALLKNGMQLGPSLIIGVRAVDPAQRAVVSGAPALPDRGGTEGRGVAQSASAAASARLLAPSHLPTYPPHGAQRPPRTTRRSSPRPRRRRCSTSGSRRARRATCRR